METDNSRGLLVIRQFVTGQCLKTYDPILRFQLAESQNGSTQHCLYRTAQQGESHSLTR